MFGRIQGMVMEFLLHSTKSLCDPTLVGEENRAFFLRVWKPFPNLRVLKTLRGSLKGKA